MKAFFKFIIELSISLDCLELPLESSSNMLEGLREFAPPDNDDNVRYPF